MEELHLDVPNTDLYMEFGTGVYFESLPSLFKNLNLTSRPGEPKKLQKCINYFPYLSTSIILLIFLTVHFLSSFFSCVLEAKMSGDPEWTDKI